MRLKDVKDDLYLYHITDIENLESIIEKDIISRNELIRSNFQFSNIADEEIIYKRNNLGDYIPFHFHPYSNFDYSIRYNNKDKTFIYLCITRNYAKENNFKILPQHPLSRESEYIIYNYEEGITIIDWDIMSKTKDELNKMRFDLNIENQIKMAECLSPKSIKINNISHIVVKDYCDKQKVENILNKKGKSVNVIIKNIF